MIYAYYQSGAKDLVKAEKEFFHSLEKSYELYHYLLQIIPDVTRYAEQRIDIAKNKYLPSEQEKNPNRRFADNSFAKLVTENRNLNQFVRNKGLSWSNNESFIKSVYDCIVASDFYEEYMNQEVSDFESDKEIWRKIFKRILQNNETLFDVLEEQSIYWNDDLDIVITFVIKTIKRFSLEKGIGQELLPMFKDDTDLTFAKELFRVAILKGESFRQLINDAVKNWDLERLAIMDLYILQVALAEITEIDGIPVSVSLNEYIDIAKVYSTSKSGNFVNGILDQIVTGLRSQNKLFKV